jgi:hypothetical protein
MASEDTLIGNDFRFQVGDGESPEVFADMCAVVDFGELGEEKPLIDVTALCDLARTYRNGLADGVEIPLACNFIQGDADIRALYADFQNDAVRSFRVTIVGSSPEEYFAFRAIIRAWKVTGPNGEKSSATFTLKVSGPLTWVHD